jgi:hypothetical protein
VDVLADESGDLYAQQPSLAASSSMQRIGDGAWARAFARSLVAIGRGRRTPTFGRAMRELVAGDRLLGDEKVIQAVQVGDPSVSGAGRYPCRVEEYLDVFPGDRGQWFSVQPADEQVETVSAGFDGSFCQAPSADVPARTRRSVVGRRRPVSRRHLICHLGDTAGTPHQPAGHRRQLPEAVDDNHNPAGGRPAAGGTRSAVSVIAVGDPQRERPPAHVHRTFLRGPDTGRQGSPYPVGQTLVAQDSRPPPGQGHP